MQSAQYQVQTKPLGDILLQLMKPLEGLIVKDAYLDRGHRAVAANVADLIKLEIVKNNFPNTVIGYDGRKQSSWGINRVNGGFIEDSENAVVLLGYMDHSNPAVDTPPLRIFMTMDIDGPCSMYYMRKVGDEFHYHTRKGYKPVTEKIKDSKHMEEVAKAIAGEDFKTLPPEKGHFELRLEG